MSAHLITTKITGNLCPRCRAITLTGLAEGLHARVDPNPLDRDGEIRTLLAGLWTYTLAPTGELVYRDPGRIAGGHLRGPILGAHRCSQIPAKKGTAAI